MWHEVPDPEEADAHERVTGPNNLDTPRKRLEDVEPPGVDKGLVHSENSQGCLEDMRFRFTDTSTTGVNFGFWAPTDPLPYQEVNKYVGKFACKKRPCRDCQHIEDEKMRTCQYCHNWMEQMMVDKRWENNMVAATKLWFCLECIGELQTLRRQTQNPNIRLNNCFLRETWLCNAHRAQANRDYPEMINADRTAAEEYETPVIDGAIVEFGGSADNVLLCVRCRAHQAVKDSNAWICKICRTIAVKP